MGPPGPGCPKVTRTRRVSRKEPTVVIVASPAYHPGRSRARFPAVSRHHVQPPLKLAMVEGNLCTAWWLEDSRLAERAGSRPPGMEGADGKQDPASRQGPAGRRPQAPDGAPG